MPKTHLHALYFTLPLTTFPKIFVFSIDYVFHRLAKVPRGGKLPVVEGDFCRGKLPVVEFLLCLFRFFFVCRVFPHFANGEWLFVAPRPRALVPDLCLLLGESSYVLLFLITGEAFL